MLSDRRIERRLGHCRRPWRGISAAGLAAMLAWKLGRKRLVLTRGSCCGSSCGVYGMLGFSGRLKKG